MDQAILLTDRLSDTHVESWTLCPHDLDVGPADWSIRKRTLHGGLSDGVEIVEVDNGALAFTILPTRGMGLWKGRYKDVDLCWSAPVIGPVHPKFVELSSRGGLGWLTGFDEWLCRCGLASNGPPGDDGGMPLTLHGRIANQPAHRLEVQIVPETRTVLVIGDVEEGGLFYPHLRMRTTYSTVLGSNQIAIHDSIENRSSQPAEMQLLYHLNLGTPLLADGSRVHVPIAELWPNNARAAEGLSNWNRFGPPTSGFAEQVYLIRPQSDEDGKTLAVLHDPDAANGLAIRWTTSELPYFNLWKNTAALEDGYVTGLEPATGFPRFRARERQAGRVVTLPAGNSWKATWSIDVFDSPADVAAACREVDHLGARTEPVIHREPLP